MEDVDVASQQLRSNSLTGECRYVAFLDIMGFKDKVARNTHDSILKDLRDLSEFISSIMAYNTNFAMFSDSLLFFTDGENQDEIVTLAELLKKVMCYATSRGIPLKGAIAKGTFTADMSKQLYFGQPLIDAYLLEEDAVVYGIIAHHTIEKEAMELEWLFADKSIQLKGGSSRHFVLRWYEKKDEVRNALSAIRMSVSSSPRRYIDNTLKLLD